MVSQEKIAVKNEKKASNIRQLPFRAPKTRLFSKASQTFITTTVEYCNQCSLVWKHFCFKLEKCTRGVFNPFQRTSWNCSQLPWTALWASSAWKRVVIFDWKAGLFQWRDSKSTRLFSSAFTTTRWTCFAGCVQVQVQMRQHLVAGLLREFHKFRRQRWWRQQAIGGTQLDCLGS